KRRPHARFLPLSPRGDVRRFIGRWLGGSPFWPDQRSEPNRQLRDCIGLECLGDRRRAGSWRPALTIGPNSTRRDDPATAPAHVEARRQVSCAIAEGRLACALSEDMVLATAGGQDNRMQWPLNLLGCECA